MKSSWKKIFVVGFGTIGTYAVAQVFAKKKAEDESIDDDNPYLTSVAPAERIIGIYEGRVKTALDKIVSFGGLLVFSPVFAIISLAILIDDPGPVFFTQKRIGKDKHYVKIHKFRSMAVSTPHDIPTHKLVNPEKYITKVGRVLRKTSLDELPQIWDIFRGRMSVIGPRPALWNQDDLVRERDKYGANSVMPGLTGLAQINGRDELEIPDKAMLDGEYVAILKNGGIKAFWQDVSCFFGTVSSVLKHEGVVEGGTGTIRKIETPTAKEAGFEDYGHLKHFSIDKFAYKKVLITGEGSYIGESFKNYCDANYQNIECEIVDMVGGSWRNEDFSGYDTVFHVAGIAHADVGKISLAEQEEYYNINTNLAIECCEKCKKSGVKQFIFMSSMIVYGGKEYIDEKTIPSPSNFYGNSKWIADRMVRDMASNNFHVAVLRPPMVYGRGSKGNYSLLSRLAKLTPIFPDVENKRSMLYIENLCEFVALLSLSGEGGIYFPQNAEYSNTSKLVKTIGNIAHSTVKLNRLLSLTVFLASHIPGKIKNLTGKAFESSYYNQKLSRYEGMDYQKVSLEESINRVEGVDIALYSNDSHCEENMETDKKRHILLISQYFYPETFRVNDLAVEWVKRGYKVTVLTGIPNYPTGRFFDGYGYKQKRKEIWNGVEIIRIPLIPRGNSSNKLLNAGGMVANYLSFVISGKRWVKKNNIGADLVFTVEVSPMTQALIGVWYGERYHVPTYLNVQDLWPENIEAITGIHNKMLLGPINKIVDKIYRETDEIFATSPRFVEAIVNRKFSVDQKKVHYWPQYAEEFYRPMERGKIDGISDDDKSFKIAFTGNIGIAQGLEVLPKAAELLKEENVKFIIVGNGRYQSEFEKQIDELGVGNMFIMIPRVQAERVPEILSVCDAGFISFNRTPLWEMTIPAKLQSYIACGKAIIASASGETKRIVEEAECGICCELGNAVALADGIRELIKTDHAAMGKRARRYFDIHFNKKKLMDEMDQYIKG